MLSMLRIIPFNYGKYSQPFIIVHSMLSKNSCYKVIKMKSLNVFNYVCDTHTS